MRKRIIGIISAVVDFFVSNLVIDAIVNSFPEDTFPTLLILAMKGGVFVGLLVLIVFILSRSKDSHDSS